MCTIDGLLEIIKICVKGRISLILAYLNSDVVENHFCMVRSLFNGASDHPDYFTYKSLQNSIILTQPLNLPKTRNSNTYVSPP